MGLHIHVYRSNLGDSTNNGISAKADQLCLVNVEGPFEPSNLHPAAMLVPGNLDGTLKIVPAGCYQNKETRNFEWHPVPGWYMAGGNYAATSDSRFSEACEKLLGHRFYAAVAIHDRKE